MDSNPFVEKIELLKKGDLKEIIVEPKDFFQFREAWVQLPDRMEITGEAGLNGKIIYRYLKKESVGDELH
jgi:hypothetical protein